MKLRNRFQAVFIHLRPCLFERIRIPGKEVKRQRETDGDGLVPISKNREQVIAHLAAGQRFVITGAAGRRQQAIHQIASRAVVRSSFAAFADEVVQRLVYDAESSTESPARGNRQILPPRRKCVDRPLALRQYVFESLQEIRSAAFERSESATESRGATHIQRQRRQVGKDVERLDTGRLRDTTLPFKCQPLRSGTPCVKTLIA